VKDLYNWNYKTSKKEAEEGTKKWKDHPCLWIGKINRCENGYTTKIKFSYSLFYEKNQMIIMDQIIKFV
jgi:hypothetical protein